MKKMLEIVNFNTSFFIDRRAGRNDVVVMVDGKEIYRQPRTRETYFAGFDIYVKEKYGMPLSEYEKRFKPTAASCA